MAVSKAIAQGCGVWLRFTIAVVSLALPCGISQAGGGTVEVNTLAGLKSALLMAQGGDLIALAPGHYGKLTLTKEELPAEGSAPVTIASADGNDPAVLSGLDIKSAGNLVFSKLVFDYTFQVGDPMHASPFSLENSSHVAITGSVFDGDSTTAAEEEPRFTARALTIFGSTHIRLSDNEFRKWHRAIVVLESDDVDVTGCDIHNIASDGMDFARVSRVRIEGNWLHDFAQSGPDDHADMIQFWTAGTTRPSTGIDIRSNVLDRGDGAWTQSIFMRNEMVDQKKAGPEMYYRDVVIADNLIRNSHVHGITVGETDGLDIANNTLIQAAPTSEGGTVAIPAINVSEASRNVQVRGNVVPRIDPPAAKPPDWAYAGNVFIQRDNPNRRDHYRFFFTNAEAPGRVSRDDLRLLPDSAAARAKAGSSLSRFEIAPGKLDGYVAYRITDARGLKLEFAAIITGLEDMNPSKVSSFNWSFGDGSTAVDATPMHAFQKAGSFPVTVKATMPDGKTVTLVRTIAIPGE